METKKTFELTENEFNLILKLKGYEHELVVLLYLYKEDQELQLKRLERIKEVAKRLNDFKSPTFKLFYDNLSAEVKEHIRKAKLYGY